MAYHLPFDGSNDYVSFNDIYPNGTTGFDFSITWEPTQLNTSYDIIVGNNTTQSGGANRHAIYQRLTELEVAFIIGGSRRLINTSGAGLSVGTVKTVRVTYDGSNLTVFIDGTQVGQVSASGTVSATTGGLKRFGRNGPQYGHIKLYSAEFKDSVNGTVINSYDPTISEGAGDPILIDKVGGNHGTLHSFSATPFVYHYDFLNPSKEDTTTDNCLKLTSASESISLPLIGSYNVDAHLTDGTTVNFTGSGTLLIDGTTPREITKVVGNDSNNDVFYDCNQSPATAPAIPELINNQNGTIGGGATYETVIDTVTFTTGDYATLPLFVTAQSANSDYREYSAGTTAGATISGFSDGVILNGGTVTSPITLTQTGIAQIKNATLDDVDATGATGDVTIIDCEVEDVTG